MRPDEMQSFRDILKDLLNTAEGPMRQGDDIAVDSAQDELDRVQSDATRELAIRRLESDALRLQNVTSALERIRDGSFGLCLRCDDPISEKRLAAIPWAAYCIRCQAIVDEEQKSAATEFAMQA